jgi:hypothetical protein
MIYFILAILGLLCLFLVIVSSSGVNFVEAN